MPKSPYDALNMGSLGVGKVSNIDGVAESELKYKATRSVLATFLGVSENDVERTSLGSYQKYYEKTWLALNEGEPPESEFMNTISDDHVRIVVEAIVIIIVKVPSGHPPFPCYRPTLRDALLKDPHFSPVPEGKPESLNRTIDLALRLWLVLYIRDGFAHAAKSIEWNDTISLQELIAGQFRKPRLLSALSEKMFDIALPDHFNAMSLRRYSGVKVKLTSSLNEHLDLDRERNKLKIFPLKYYLYGLRRRSETPLMEVGYRLTCLK